jgi:hypothetical protein
MQLRLKIAVVATAAIMLLGALGVALVSAATIAPPGENATFAGSYSFPREFFDNGRLVASETQTIGFGTDGHWTMTKCRETGTYRYNPQTDTLTFTDTTDAADGIPAYTWVGIPSRGFVGTMRSTVGGRFINERGTAVATPNGPRECEL